MQDTQIQEPALRSLGPVNGIAAGVLIATAMAGAGWWAWQGRQRAVERAALAERTAAVVRKDVLIKVSAAGTIQPLTPVNISPKAPGRLVSLLVDQGDQVKKGQVLARMDDANLKGPLLRARGNLAAAQANLREAEAQQLSIAATDRSNQQLYRAGAVSHNDFIASRAQVLANQSHIDSLRAQVVQAKGDLETAQAEMNDTVIRAPFSGVITQKYANVGAFVTPTTSASATSSATSSSILALASPLEAVANVSEIDEPSIYPGQPVEIRVDAYPDRVAHGAVRLIAPESVVVQNVTSFTVRISIAAPDLAKLRSGMNITASFLVGRHRNALLIPTPAIVSQKEGTGVYLLGPRQRPVFHPIQVGATVGTMTEVLAGLKEGERIFITFPGARRPNAKPVTSSSPFAQPGGAGRPPR
jgi:HlyD family secretion protein